MNELDWYSQHDCTHAHCPLECEKPQPMLRDGKMLCMKCWVLDGIESEVIPCTPSLCGDED